MYVLQITDYYSRTMAPQAIYILDINIYIYINIVNIKIMFHKYKLILKIHSYKYFII